MDASNLLIQYAEGQRDFQGAVLNQANLYRAHLSFITLDEANLFKADLRHANLVGANLNHADLSSANMSDVNLIGADLIRAKLAGATLSRAMMSGANLSGANLRRSDLRNASLAGANLSGADFTGAILDNTNLEGAELKGANFSDTDLSKIDLSNLDLDEAILSEKQAVQIWELHRTNARDRKYQVKRTIHPSIIEDFSTQPGVPALKSGQAGVERQLTTHDNRPLLNPPAVEPAIARDRGEEVQADLTDPFVDPFTDPFTDPFNPQPEPELTESFAISAEDTTDLWGHADTDEEATELLNPPLTNEEDEITTIRSHTNTDDEETLLLQPLTPTAPVVPTAEPTPPDASTPISTAEITMLRKPTSAEAIHHHVAEVIEQEQAQSQRHDISPATISDNRKSQVLKSIQTVLKRRGEFNFQQGLLELYQHRCAITDCQIPSLLEAVLIAEPDKADPDHPSSGFVLRIDIYKLYQAHLIAIDPKTLSVLIAPSLQAEADYQALQGKKLWVPTIPGAQPNPKLLAQHLENCSWYHESPIPPQSATVSATDSHSRSQLAQTLIKAVPQPLQKSISRYPQRWAIGGGAALVILAGGLWLGNRHPQAVTSTPPSNANSVSTLQSNSKTEPKQDSKRINLSLNQINYPQRGVILNNSAYIPLSVADQLGIATADLATREQVQYEGEAYVKAADLKPAGVELDWNAQSRTMSLKAGTAQSDIQMITLEINGKSYPAAGVIVHDSAHIPIKLLEQLAIDPTQIAENERLEYQDQAYVKAANLKKLHVSLNWDKETRTMSLTKGS